MAAIRRQARALRSPGREAEERRPRTAAEAGDERLKSLAKVARILDCFSLNDRTLTLAELSQRSGYPKATVHRLVTSMRDVGFLDQDRKREHYRLGLKLLELGNLTLSNMDLHREARAHVEILQRLTGLMVNLAVFDGYHAIAIHRFDPMLDEISRRTFVESAPLHCTSVGKAILAFQSPEIIDRVIDAGLERFTDTTITDGNELRRELSFTRERGYSIDNAEHQPGLRCIGAPIRDQLERVIAAISASGSAWKISPVEDERVAKVVVHHANMISVALGYRA